MGADNLKYDPALGVYDEASLRAAGRYLDALHYEINGREDWIGDEYFRCERMLIAVERAISAHDHGIDEDDRYYRKPDQQDEAAAEIGRLRGEVEQLRVQLAGCGVIAMCNTRESLAKQMPERGAYGWSVSLEDCRNAVEREMALRERLDSTAPAMPNGVEGLQRWSLAAGSDGPAGYLERDPGGEWVKFAHVQARAADNRDAAGVAEEYDEGPTWTHDGKRISAVFSGDGKVGLVITANPGAVNGRIEFIGAPVPIPITPAAVPAGEAAAWIRDNLPESLHGMGVVDVLQLLLDGGIAAEKDLIDAESPQPAGGGAVDFWVCPDCTHYYMTDGVICDCHGRAGQQRMRHVRMVPMVTTPPAAQVQAAPQEGSDHG